MADDQPPGVHLIGDGRVATVVFEGERPDEVELAAVQDQLVPWGLTITSAPDHAPRSSARLEAYPVAFSA